MFKDAQMTKVDYPNVYPFIDPDDLKQLQQRKVLLIDRHVAQQLLTPDGCLHVLELALKEEGLKTAVNRTKTNIHIDFYRYCSMKGGISGMEAVAIRIKSDVSRPRWVHGQERGLGIAAIRGRFMGLTEGERERE